MGLAEELQNANSVYLSAVSHVLGKLHKKLQELPENEDVTPIVGKSTMYTVKFSSLGNNWSSRYHNFKMQYQMIMDKLDSLQNPLKKLSALQDMADTGRVTYKQSYHGMSNQYYEQLNPKVIEYLKSIL